MLYSDILNCTVSYYITLHYVMLILILILVVDR